MSRSSIIVSHFLAADNSNDGFSASLFYCTFVKYNKNAARRKLTGEKLLRLDLRE
jgi:hypothetical protein